MKASATFVQKQVEIEVYGDSLIINPAQRGLDWIEVFV